MTRTKKLYGFRLGENIPKWKDRFGKDGGRIINFIPLNYCNNFQILISNGNICSSEGILPEDFFSRNLANNQ